MASGRTEDLRNAVGAPRPAVGDGGYSCQMRTAAAFLIFVLSFVLPAPARAQQAAATVTFLHFNDVYEITPGRSGADRRAGAGRASARGG